MGCFLVPAAEAVVATVVSKKEDTQNGGDAKQEMALIPFSRKVKWLKNLLWGGSALLAFEHVWHGEVVPWFPFLTAAGNPSDLSAMFHEMATSGVGMAVLVTAVWGAMVIVTNRMEESIKREKLTIKGGIRS